MSPRSKEEVVSGPPPYMSVVTSSEGPMLLLTVSAEELTVCDRCPNLHVRVLNYAVTPEVIRRLAAQLLTLADGLKPDERAANNESAL